MESTIEISTKKYHPYKGSYNLTGLVSANYYKAGNNYYGAKVLFFITNCPNRYQAKKAAILASKTLETNNFDNYNHEKMPLTKVIEFNEFMKN